MIHAGRWRVHISALTRESRRREDTNSDVGSRSSRSCVSSRTSQASSGHPSTSSISISARVAYSASGFFVIRRRSSSRALQPGSTSPAAMAIPRLTEATSAAAGETRYHARGRPVVHCRARVLLP